MVAINGISERFLVFDFTCSDNWNGELVFPVCIRNLVSSDPRSFLVSHLFFAVITMVLNQSVGAPIGTGVMMPLSTSSQRLSLLPLCSGRVLEWGYVFLWGLHHL